MINELLEQARGFRPAPGYLLLRRIVIDSLINDFQNEHLGQSCFGTVVGVGGRSINFWDNPVSFFARIVWAVRRNPFTPLHKGLPSDISSRFYDHPIGKDDVRIGDVVAFYPVCNDKDSHCRLDHEYLIVRYDNVTAKVKDGVALPIGGNVIVEMDLGSIDVGGVSKTREGRDSWEKGLHNGQTVIMRPKYAVPVAPFSRSLLSSPNTYSIPKQKILLYVTG